MDSKKGSWRTLLAVLAPCLVVAWLVPGPTESRAEDEGWWRGGGGTGAFGRASRRHQNRPRSAKRKAYDALNARLDDEFRSAIPLMSPASVGALNAAIFRYQSITARGGWRPIPSGATLRSGSYDRRVSALRRRLEMTGDLRYRSNSDWRFDRRVQEAVARFQRRHGLRVTGEVDGRTLRVMNVPAQTRLEQLRLNLSRQLERGEADLGERYVLVNIPEFRLQAVDGEIVHLRSNVVVGKSSRKTPELSALIKNVNFYPFWRVPDSIAHRDLIPKLREDPGYFHREHFSVLKAWGTDPLDPQTINWHDPSVMNYKFRQDPGPWNALGLVRIDMPNKETVYLHDTPLKKLFAQNARAFSAGCVRVERVFDLVQWLLRDDERFAVPGSVQQAVDAGQSEDIKLKKPVKVHFVYVTAWASERGLVSFRNDIYDQDGLIVVAQEDRSRRRHRTTDGGDRFFQGLGSITP